MNARLLVSRLLRPARPLHKIRILIHQRRAFSASTTQMSPADLKADLRRTVKQKLRTLSPDDMARESEHQQINLFALCV